MTEFVDSPYVDRQPIVRRMPLRWPDAAPVVVCVLVHIQYIEWAAPHHDAPPRGVVGRGNPGLQVPDIHELSPHEYGNRVGIFRLIDALDAHRIQATASIDAAAAKRYGYVVQECVSRGWELVGRGVTSGRLVSGRMSGTEEADYIRASLAPVAQVTGTRVRGWSGVEFGESARTVGLLADLGIEYVCGWPNDEQPYRMRTESGDMYALPVATELDDLFAIKVGGLSASRLSEMVQAHFDRLSIEGGDSGRLIVLSVNPSITGQPLRIKYFRETLSYLASNGARFATGGEVTDWYRAAIHRE